MNSRSTLFKSMVIILLLAVVLLQVLAMMQSDRLFVRVNQVEKAIKSRTVVTAKQIETPQENQGDWLIYCLSSEPATLNPITYSDAYFTIIAGDRYGNIFESLLTYDFDTLELVPLLAESYEISPDGLVIDFILKDGLTFSDGHPVTSEDIVFSFETITNPSIDAAQKANYFADVEKCIAVDEKHVRFVMSKLYFKSLETVGSMAIIPKHIYKFDDPMKFNKIRSNPVGSGPYVFEKWDVASQIVLAKNESYWGKKPNLSKIIFKFITNSTAALQAFKSGDVDILGVTTDQYVEFSKDAEFLEKFSARSAWNPLSGYSYVGWNMESKFFADRRVRLAMTHLIDREGMNKHLYHSLTKVVSGPFYFESSQNNPDITPWSYDPSKAKELLTQAGWIDTDGDGILDKDGVAFEFSFVIPSGSETMERMMKLMKDEMAKVGVILKPDPYEWSVFLEKMKSGEFDSVSLAWTSSILADPYQIWHSSQTMAGGSNRIGFRNDEADAIIEQARETLDPIKRDELYHRFHEIIHYEQPYTFMFARPSLSFMDKRFENVILHKLGTNPHEWYVPLDKQRYK